MILHLGKLDYPIETNVTEAFRDMLIAKAHLLGIPKAELHRDLLWLGATGQTYAFHVAKDKEMATRLLLADLRDKSGSEGGR